MPHVPLSEAIRLAQHTSAIPLTSDPGSTIRSRKPAGKPLIDSIPSALDDHESDPHGDEEDDDKEGVRVEEVDLRDYDVTRKRQPRQQQDQAKAKLDLGDEIFMTSMLVIPLSALFLLLDILAHKQYNRHPPSWDYVRRLFSAVPTLAILVFLTNRFPTHLLTNPLLMIASTLCGCRLLYLVNKSSFLVVMAQAPPVGTLWILTVIQLPLGRCLIALVAMLGWCWYAGMKFRP